jgi:threonine dehydratase
LEAGKPVDIPERESLAHNLAGSIGLDNHVTFPLVRDLVDAVVVVEEDAIAEAMAVLYEAEGLVAEGAGAAATAALLRNLDKPRTQRPVAILSGRNVDPDLFKTTVAARAPARR